jgi:phosphoglycerate dehydrogenase-like enzyme
MKNIIVSLALVVAWSLCGAAAAASTLEQEKERLSAEAVQLMIAELGLRASATPSSELPGWGEVTKIVARYPAERIAELQILAPAAEVVAVESAEEAAAAVPGAQVLLGFCSEKVLAGADGLHWVQVYSSGVERCVSLPAMQKGERLLTNGQRIASPALAEHAIALMIALVRGIDVYYPNQLQGEWRRNVNMERNEFMELDGRTMLVVGLGGIGTQVARKAHGLGMRVLATRGSRREGPDFVEYVGLSDETVALAAQADVVVNTVPLTDRTRGMFDAAFFEAMKPTAFYVSVGRGATTVTEDLLAALNDGQLAGAGLDVTDPEPLPEGHPLWSSPRVIITPHVGGRSDRGRERLYLLVRENLRRYVAGEPMLSVVDIQRGY